MIRVAGCDLGKTSASFVLAAVRDDGEFVLEHTESLFHGGNPFDAFRRWYLESDVASYDLLGATGMFADQLVEPVLVFPEDSCQQAALEQDPSLPDTFNLVSFGGLGYSVLSCRPSPIETSGRPFYQHLENDKCSSGIGENIQRIVDRFGLTIEEADLLAQTAKSPLPITARCSVFAKSEITHYANQGKATADLLMGYFASMARSVSALLERNHADGPVYLIGGGARIKSFRSSLAQQLDCDLQIPTHYLIHEAIGAAALAYEMAWQKKGAPLPKDPVLLIRARSSRFKVLEPASIYRDKVTIMPPPTIDPHWEQVPAVLGLDLGSTGAKAVLVAVEDGRPLLDVYDQTRGNPVDATRRLVRAITGQGRPDIRAIGITGSGREAVAVLLRAVFPNTEQIVVQNEIVAHASAALHCNQDDGADMSVVEIGGQDAKYIRIRDGRIVESDLNKVCSAGTGSFLEEQAVLYAINDIDEFTRLASEAIRPPDLGQMCTVHVSDAASQALREGFSLGDVFAGFQHSVIRNYLRRVMGQRTLGKRILFQGKPAQSPSLAWTLAAITGREITVPPNPGAMGAWGIALCTSQELGQSLILAAQPLDPKLILEAEVVGRSEFRCQESGCETKCPIERTTVRMNNHDHVAFSGGACSRFEVLVKHMPGLDNKTPNPFLERDRLLATFETRNHGKPEVAIPAVGASSGYIPWLATLIHELGFSVKILRSDSSSLARGEHLCKSFDSCAPVKIAHAVCDTEVRLLLFPKILGVDGPNGVCGETCVTEQSMPEFAEQTLRTRGRRTPLLRPRLDFRQRDNLQGLANNLHTLAAQLGVSSDRLYPAVQAADQAQKTYEEKLLEIGMNALAHGRANGVPLILVCGPLHVIHDGSVNANIPRLLRQCGALAIPMDCFPMENPKPGLKRILWGESKRLLRSAEAARESRDIFPLMISSFGCGPASFLEQFFQSVLDNYPHAILESDGHGGSAGFLTRIQAFLHSAREFSASQKTPPANEDTLSYAARDRPAGALMDRSVQYVFPCGPDNVGELIAAVYRSRGFDAVVAPALSETNLAIGQQNCSGKECLPYQMLWGAFHEHLKQRNPTERETRLMQISPKICRASVFSIKDTMSLQRLGLDDRVSVWPFSLMEVDGKASLWTGLTVIDVLRQLYLYYLPFETSTGEIKAAYGHYADAAIQLLEQPVPSGTLKKTAQLMHQWLSLSRIVEQAAEYFTRFNDQPDHRNLLTVFVTGDIMSKGNDFANGGLYQQLADRGVRVVVEPLCDYFEFLGQKMKYRPRIFGERRPLSKRMMISTPLFAMSATRSRIYAKVRPLHPWLPIPDVAAAMRQTEELLDRVTSGGVSLTVGNSLRHWKQGGFDGIVLAGCWGCDDGLILENLLRNRREIPTFFHYEDGTPLDDRRLSSFVFRLRRGLSSGA